MSNTPTTQFNQELCDLVRSGKLAIEFNKQKDSEQSLQTILDHIYPKDKEPVRDFIHTKEEDIVFLERDPKFIDLWTYCYETTLPTRPVSDFFLPAVSDGEEEAIMALTDELGTTTIYSTPVIPSPTSTDTGEPGGDKKFTSQDIITAFDSGAYAGATKTDISGHEYLLNKYGNK